MQSGVLNDLAEHFRAPPDYFLGKPLFGYQPEANVSGSFICQPDSSVAATKLRLYQELG